MKQATIIGTGFHVPSRVIKNQFFNDLYKKDVDSFLREKRNIFERRWMEPEQCTSDLIIPAAQQALKNAGIQAKDLNLIIVATDTPDYLSPATAAVVQYKLGATQAGCFDLNSACAGFVTACDVGNKFIQADSRYRYVLVVGAYSMSKWLNLDDYKIATLFADGASAAVLSPSQDDTGFLASELYADGQYHDYMGIYAGGSYKPITHEVLEKREHLLNFAKKIPIETNGTHWPRLTKKLLNTIGQSEKDIRHFFMTQINIESIHEALDALGLDHSLSHNVMDRFGYTGSASVGMCMADAVEKRKLKKGDLCILLGSGGGLSMAAMALRWSYDT